MFYSLFTRSALWDLLVIWSLVSFHVSSFFPGIYLPWWSLHLLFDRLPNSSPGSQQWQVQLLLRETLLHHICEYRNISGRKILLHQLCKYEKTKVFFASLVGLGIAFLPLSHEVDSCPGWIFLDDTYLHSWSCWL